MPTVYLNIGSNLGNRLINLDKAIDLIQKEFGNCRRSCVVESEPWGFDSTNYFLNIGIAFESDQAPHSILRKLQDIEKEISETFHRDEEGNYIDRLIDIDIMAIDHLKISSRELTLPHPHLFDRDFFLTPLLELNSEWLKEEKHLISI